MRRETLPPSVNEFDRIDRGVVRLLRRYGLRVLRVSLAAVFVVFGLLKPLGLSPAEPLVLATAEWTAGVILVPPRVQLHVIGWWEVAIGVCLLVRPWIRVGILLMAFQMAGTLMPLIVLPEVAWRQDEVAGVGVYVPTLEGQYILKNAVLLAAAAVVGSTVRRHSRPREKL